jgi:hypothetical protein
LAKEVTDDKERFCDMLSKQKKLMFQRALIAWERSPETFWEEIVALNDIDEALRNNCN